MLVHPDFEKSFVLFTDASNVTVSVILTQLNKNKVDYPIFYYSKTLSQAKQNYSVTERDLLAVLLDIKHFCPFLYGTHFTIVTDYFSLWCLQEIKYPDGLLVRWALKL